MKKQMAPVAVFIAVCALSSPAFAADPNSLEVVKHFRSKSPKSTLVALTSEKIPLEELLLRGTVNVMTSAGAEFEGHVLAADEGAGYVTMLGLNGELISLAYDRIESVTIAKPFDYASVLAPGVVFRSANDPVPGVLELERKMSEIAKPAPMTISFDAMPQLEKEAECRRNLRDILDGIQSYLKVTSKTPDGSAALLEVQSLLLNQNPGTTAIGAKKEGKSIRITFDCASPLSSGFRKEIADALDSVL